MSAPTPSAAQVHALLARAANATLSPDEQRLIGQLLRQARASLAGQDKALRRITDERDALRAGEAAAQQANHLYGQEYALRQEAEKERDMARSDRDALRMQVDHQGRAITTMGDDMAELRHAIEALEDERDQLRQRLAARDDEHAPAAVDCPRCPAKAGRPCRAPSGQQVPYHSPRRIRAQQQAAGVGQ